MWCIFLLTTIFIVCGNDVVAASVVSKNNLNLDVGINSDSVFQQVKDVAPVRKREQLVRPMPVDQVKPVFSEQIKNDQTKKFDDEEVDDSTVWEKLDFDFRGKFKALRKRQQEEFNRILGKFQRKKEKLMQNKRKFKKRRLSSRINLQEDSVKGL